MKRKLKDNRESQKKKKLLDDDIGTYLLGHGVQLGDSRHSTVRDTDKIVKSLSVKMLDSEEREKFFVSLQDYIEEPKNFKVSMLPMESEESMTHFSSESLIKLLLRITPLTECLTELLLEKLPIVSDERDCNMAALIVSQLRWMTNISSDLIINKLNEVLPVCPLPVQKEMISGIPEVLSDDAHNDACVLLLDHITTIELVPVILETLSELTLSTKMLDQVYVSVEELLSALTSDSIPAALRFLLSTSSPDKAISSIRQHIDFQSLATSGEGTEAEEMSLECLEQMLRFHCKIQKCWLSHLQKSKALTVFDILVLLVLYRVSNKPRLVMSVIKLHLKQGAINPLIIQEMYSSHSRTVNLYSKELLQISYTLLVASPDHPVPAAFYLYLFIHGDLHTKQEAVGSLISHIGSGQQKEVNCAIKTLELIQDNTDRTLDKFSALLNGLLDYLNTLSITQARQVLALLVKMSVSDSSRIMDDIHIITRKYLTHSYPKLNKLGVIGSCALIQGMQSAAQVESFVKRVLDTISRSTTLLALFYDELATSIATRQLDTETINLLYELVITEFQEKYISDEACGIPEQRDILCIEGSDTLDSNNYIAIDLWQNVARQQHDDLQLLFPQLRLVSTCVSVLHNNDMNEVDSLLGCFIRAVPLDSIVESSDTLGMLSLINLVIELINSFHLDEKVNMKNKVIQRVENLYQFIGMLRHIPTSGKLVPMVFDVEEELKPGKSKKGQSSKAASSPQNDKSVVADITRSVFSFDPDKDGTPKTSTQIQDKTVSTAAQMDKSDSKPKQTKLISTRSVLKSYTGYIRELDISSFKVLDFIVQKHDAKSGNSAEEMDSDAVLLELKLPETVMLLEDLLAKCRFKLKPQSVFSKDSSLGFSRISAVSDTRFVQLVMSLLPALCHILEENVDQSPGLQSTNDTGMDIDMDTTLEEIAKMEENPYRVKVFELIFMILELVFSWPGFSTNCQVSTECFTILSSRLHTNTQGPLSVRKKHALQYLLNFHPSCQTFSSVISLLKCCSVISHSQDPQLCKISKAGLQRDWELTPDEKDNGVRYNEGIGYLVKTYIKHSDTEKCGILQELIEDLDHVIAGKKEERTFVTLTKPTLPTVYKIVLIELVAYVQTITSTPGNETTILRNSCTFFVTLLGYIRTLNSRPILRSAIIYGQKFLEQFLSLGMPLLNNMIKVDYVEVQALLKKVQSSTRLLHHVTSHSKFSKDLALTARVPLLKKLLESFVLKVKAMLAANGCTEAFWVGNLKQRNLKGEEIVSQVVEEEEEEEEEDDLSELSVTDDEDEDNGSRETGENTDSMSIGY